MTFILYRDFSVLARLTEFGKINAPNFVFWFGVCGCICDTRNGGGGGGGGGRSLRGQAKSAGTERGEFPGYNTFLQGSSRVVLRKDGGFFSPNLLTNSP